MRKAIIWLDNQLLLFLSGFLLLFIPLYPKIPLVDILPGYIVRVRLEDLFIAISLIIYGVYVLRKKVTFWETPLTKPILIYALTGVLALLSGIFITQMIPLQSLHINKAVLHYVRRLEYFSLFFIFFSSIKSIRSTKILIVTYLIAMMGVALYGFGQKYLYWPVYSTMNREFSKGITLYLSEHARVNSTFGGHYDLAAFTMVALAILWSLLFGLKKWWQKLLIATLLAASFWLIILTASRISFLAYLLALTVVIGVWTLRKGIRWGFSRWIIAVGLSLFIMFSFGDLSERFTRLFKLDQRFGGITALLLKPIGAPPPQGRSVNDVLSKSDQTPSADKNQKPVDVSQDTPDYKTITTDTGDVVSIPTKRIYSQAAIRYDLSTAIRLDVLWPRAWQGFLRDPLSGSGYSTLTKARPTDFTEAESTDNGFFRSLGETGALGTIAFYAIIATVMLQIWFAIAGIQDKFILSFLIGGFAGIFGLLLNNVYIDTFEASKVALPFWSLSGIMLGSIAVLKEDIKKHQKNFYINIDYKKLTANLQKNIKSDRLWLLIIVVLALIVRLYKFDNPIADWHSWRQADTSAVTRNFFHDGINWFYPTYEDISSIPSGKDNPRGLRMVEFPVYNAVASIVKKLSPELNVEQSGRLTSILASLGSLIFLFFIVRKYADRFTAYLAAFFFAVLPFNIYYSRVVLPEPSVVFSVLATVYFFDRWLEYSSKNHPRTRISVLENTGLWIVSFGFASIAVLIKPYALFYYLPLLYLISHYLGWRGFIKPQVILLIVGTMLPFFGWRWWISHFPEGIPASDWLFNGDNIRFKGAFFYWLFADRIGRLILGYWGVALLVIGIIVKRAKHEGWFFYTFLLSSVLYLAIIATGNVRHDYYQTLIIPSLIIFVAKGMRSLFTKDVKFNSPFITVPLGVVCVAFMIGFGWYSIRDYFNINHPEIVEAGRKVDAVVPEKALVIAPYNGDTAFLYQTGRTGWPLMQGSIDDMVKKGAHYYVSVNYDDLTNQLVTEATRKGGNNKYKLIFSNPSFAIIQLVPDDALPR